MERATQERQPRKGLTFEDVWAMFQESKAEHDRMIAETDRKFQETDRKFQESRTEHDRIIAETDRKFQETDRLVKETTKAVDRMAARVDRVTENVDKMSARVDRVTGNVDKMAGRVDRVTKNVGGLNRSVGELVETLIAARLWEKFPGYNLNRAYQRLPLYDENNQIKTDIDILLVNTDMCMAVEVKRELDRKDEVDEHLKRMRLIRQYPPEQVGGKQLLGAMAGGTVNPDVKNYAYECGFFVLALAGESARLIPPPDGFEPKKW